jgi:hypothetical protein
MQFAGGKPLLPMKSYLAVFVMKESSDFPAGGLILFFCRNKDLECQKLNDLYESMPLSKMSLTRNFQEFLQVKRLDLFDKLRTYL